MTRTSLKPNSFNFNVKVTNLPLLLSFDGEKYNEMVNLADSSLKSIRYPPSIRKVERTEKSCKKSHYLL